MLLEQPQLTNCFPSHVSVIVLRLVLVPIFRKCDLTLIISFNLMKVSGFSFVRNAIKYGYPAAESIKSILPICDEFIVSVGNSEDDTLQLIQSIPSDKIRIIQSVWDDSIRERGRVLAVETNKAFNAVSSDSDWAFYLQADEVVHEKYLDAIAREMLQWKDHPRVEGLLLKYLHFYGTYDYIGDSRRWYRREIRVVRNDKRIRSFKDAQGFRIDDRKMRVKLIDAYVYHYGWIKHPKVMQEKMKNFHRYWHEDDWIRQEMGSEELFDYSQIDSLQKFTGTHPEVMQECIAEIDWKLNFDPLARRIKAGDRLLKWIENCTGVRFGEYRNYKVV